MCARVAIHFVRMNRRGNEAGEQNFNIRLPGYSKSGFTCFNSSRSATSER